MTLTQSERAAWDHALERLARRDYIHDPAAWARDRLGMHLWSKQRDIADSVVANKRTAVKSCHGAGKSFDAAAISCHWLDTHPAGEALVVSTAPSHEQVHAVLWEEIRRLHRLGGLAGEVQRSDRWLDPNGTLIGLGRRPPDHQQSAFQGLHRRYVLAVLDEAGGIPAWLWTAVEAITTGDDCRILAIGNPDDNSSEFARVCDDPTWHPIKISAFDTPNLTGEPVPRSVSDVLVSRDWVEDKLRRWGEDSPLYKAKVLAEFADAEDALIPLSWVIAAQQRWRDWDDAGRPTQPGRLIVGVDVARFGTDKTALAVRRGDVIERVDRHARLDTVQTTDLVAGLLQGVPGAVAVVDDIGLGGGVTDQLRHRRLGVRPFTASAATKQRDGTGELRMRNLRSAAWWNAREMLDPANGPGLALPPDDELAAELCAPKWSVQAGGVVQVESKDDIRKRLGRSTDSADAVLQAIFREQTPELDGLGRITTGRVHRHADAVSWNL